MKNIIKNSPEVVREAAEINKSIIITHKKDEKEIRNKIDRDKNEIKLIPKVMNTVVDDLDVKEIEEFRRFGKYEIKSRPLKVTFQRSNTVEEIMKNAYKLKEDEETKDIWIKRCLSKEDADLVKGKREEAKKKK